MRYVIMDFRVITIVFTFIVYIMGTLLYLTLEVLRLKYNNTKDEFIWKKTE